jgi:hypothetical protein
MRGKEEVLCMVWEWKGKAIVEAEGQGLRGSDSLLISC